MHRLFGKKKPEGPKPTLDDASNSMTKRGDTIDQKIAKLDSELMKYKQQMSKMRDGPAKQQLQRRAINVLKQKKMYQGQRDTLYNQQFNIDQTKFATEGIKDTQTTIAAMKTARTELKKGMKEMNLDEVEDLHDDMADLMEDTNEIQVSKTLALSWHRITSHRRSCCNLWVGL
jgi:charged multivesicular body protein 5